MRRVVSVPFLLSFCQGFVLEHPHIRRQHPGCQSTSKLHAGEGFAKKSGPKKTYDSDVEFIDVFKLKKNRNKIDLPFKGIGKKKLLLLIEAGITSAKELLEYDGSDQAVNVSTQSMTLSNTGDRGNASPVTINSCIEE